MSLVTGYWLLVTGYWLLVSCQTYYVANLKLAVGKKQLAILRYFLFTVLDDTSRDFSPYDLTFCLLLPTCYEAPGILPYGAGRGWRRISHGKLLPIAFCQLPTIPKYLNIKLTRH